MQNVVTNSLLILALFALGVSLAYAVRYVRRREETRTGVAMAANLVGLALLLVDFVYVSFQRGAVALTALGDSIVFFAIVLLAVNNVAVRASRSHIVSLLVTPLAMLLVVMGLFFERWFPTGEAQLALGQGFLTLHIMLFLVSYALFVVAAAFGAMFLALDGSLKAKTFSPVFFKLPGLARLDVFASRSALAGLALLTLSIALALGNLVRSGGGPRIVISDFTVVTTYAIWFYYAAFAVSRMRFGLVGRRSCLMAVGGLVLVLLVYVGGKVVPTGTLHGPGAPTVSSVAPGVRQAGR